MKHYEASQGVMVKGQDHLEVEDLVAEGEDRLKVQEEGRLKVEEEDKKIVVDQPKVLRAVEALPAVNVTDQWACLYINLQTIMDMDLCIPTD